MRTVIISYMILAPNEMQAEPDERKAAKVCLETIQLDPELYRIGHTKARSKLEQQHPIVTKQIKCGFLLYLSHYHSLVFNYLTKVERKSNRLIYSPEPKKETAKHKWSSCPILIEDKSIKNAKTNIT